MSSVPETRVPGDDAPVARCPHCGRPFADEHLRDLHVGEVHEAAASPAEQEAHEAALETERDRLFGYQLRVVIVLGVTYAVMVIVLMVLLSGTL